MGRRNIVREKEREIGKQSKRVCSPISIRKVLT